jgi:hypothetical protein
VKGRKNTPPGLEPNEGFEPWFTSPGASIRREIWPRTEIGNRKELNQWEAEFRSWGVGSYTLRSMPKLNIANVFEAAL